MMACYCPGRAADLGDESASNMPEAWTIFYWIGAETSLDKKAGVAIAAVNLRTILRVARPTRVCGA